MDNPLKLINSASRSKRFKRWGCMLIPLVALVGGCASTRMVGNACSVEGTQSTELPQSALNNANDLITVDCLLPGRLVHQGMYLEYMTPPRPAIVSAWECKVRGGRYEVGANRDSRQKAIDVWQRCAHQGDRVAQNYLGEIYARRWKGVAPDFNRAALWFRKAADQGYGRAQKNLGILYEHGLGVPKDPQTALKLFRQAIGQIVPFSLDQNTKGEIQELSDRLDAFGQKSKTLQQQLDNTKILLRNKQLKLDELRRQTLPVANPTRERDLRDELNEARINEQRLRELLSVALQKIALTSRQLNKTETRAALGVRPYLGRYFALVIGINNYRSPLAQLRTPVNDARQIDTILRRKYGFKTVLLTDDSNIKPTRKGIFTALEEIKRKVTENDNLLIYYAGHGDISSNRYHWLPQDADSNLDTNWVSLDDIKKKIDKPPMKAKHVLVIADSCYPAGIIASVINASTIKMATVNIPSFSYRSGMTRFVGTMSVTPATPYLANANPESQVGWIKAKSENLSRTALTSGLLEPVPDVDSGNGLSIFANAFLEALKNNDDVISAEQIYLDISPVVYAKLKKIGKNQMPAYGTIPNTGHNFGEFFFISNRRHNPG